jgi:hypothetical protein
MLRLLWSLCFSSFDAWKFNPYGELMRAWVPNRMHDIDGVMTWYLTWILVSWSLPLMHGHWIPIPTQLTNKPTNWYAPKLHLAQTHNKIANFESTCVSPFSCAVSLFVSLSLVPPLYYYLTNFLPLCFLRHFNSSFAPLSPCNNSTFGSLR